MRLADGRCGSKGLLNEGMSEKMKAFSQRGVYDFIFDRLKIGNGARHLGNDL